MHPTERKIQVARSQLLLNNPFFGILAMRLSVVADPNFSTAATDGKHLFYDTAFMERLSPAHRLTIVAHEVMHCVLDHMSRRGSRNPALWNIACDYVVNLILVDSGFSLPDTGLIDQQYKDLSTEAVYDKLLSELPPAVKELMEKGADPGGMGGVIDAPSGSGTTSELSEDWKQATLAAASQAAGRLPASIARIVDRIRDPLVPWQALLRDFLHEPFKGDYTWKRPNKRYAHANIHFPTLHADATGHIVVAIDTSGSITDELLAQFFSEVSAIFSEVKPSALHVIYCDAAINHIDVFHPGDNPLPSPCGGGGTDFVPPFAYLESEGITPAAFIYLTDLMCNSYPTPPSYPVLWVCPIEKPHHPPFGSVININ